MRKRRESTDAAPRLSLQMSSSTLSSSASPSGPCWCVITTPQVRPPGDQGKGCVGGLGIATCRLTYFSFAALADWFMSLGIGLLTFASLETIGIYFGLGKLRLKKPHRPAVPWRVAAGKVITLAKSHNLSLKKKSLMSVFSS